MLLENNESTFEDLDKAYLALLAAKNGLVEKVDSDKTKLNSLSTVLAWNFLGYLCWGIEKQNS